MCYVIASSLFEEATKADRTQLFYLSANVLIHCLAMYEKCSSSSVNNETSPTSAGIPNLKDVMTSSLRAALAWMQTWMSKWDIYMYDVLQVKMRKH